MVELPEQVAQKVEHLRQVFDPLSYYPSGQLFEQVVVPKCSIFPVTQVRQVVASPEQV